MPADDPKDLEALNSANQTVARAIAQLRELAESVDDQGCADDLDDFAAALEEDRAVFEHLATQYTAARDETESKARGESEEIAAVVAGGVIDIRDIHEGRTRKWYSPKKRSSKKRGICFHHTAVKGGFGTHKNRRQLYEGKPRDYARWREEPSGDISDADYVNAMALAHRYRGDKPSEYNQGVPYHVLSGNNGVLYLNLPFDWVTWHGNRANQDFLGFGWDALSSKDELPRERLLDQVRYLVALARDEGHPIEEFTVHAAWTNKPRDPGPAFIREVMRPLADELGCTINEDFKHSGKCKSIAEILSGG